MEPAARASGPSQCRHQTSSRLEYRQALDTVLGKTPHTSTRHSRRPPTAEQLIQTDPSKCGARVTSGRTRAPTAAAWDSLQARASPAAPLEHNKGRHQSPVQRHLWSIYCQCHWRKSARPRPLQTANDRPLCGRRHRSVGPFRAGKRAVGARRCTEATRTTHRKRRGTGTSRGTRARRWTRCRTQRRRRAAVACHNDDLTKGHDAKVNYRYFTARFDWVHTHTYTQYLETTDQHEKKPLSQTNRWRPRSVLRQPCGSIRRY